jgi:hypothetical protein
MMTATGRERAAFTCPSCHQSRLSGEMQEQTQAIHPRRNARRLARTAEVPYYRAMTTRRRLLVFGLLAGLLALGAGVWFLWMSVESNAIRPGMTLAEVTEILGPPDGIDGNMHGAFGFWERRTGMITVRFSVNLGEDLKVVSVQGEPLFERVRRWTEIGVMQGFPLAELAAP